MSRLTGGCNMSMLMRLVTRHCTFELAYRAIGNFVLLKFGARSRAL
jgi:hypothetical protein